jgi:hypothetical protein
MNLRFNSAALAAMLICGTSATALALTASIGQGSNGGTSVSVGQGSASVSATVGGGSSVGSATVGAAGTSTTATVGNGSGDLVSTSSDGSNTSADVNLGGLGLGGIDLGGLLGDDGTGGGSAATRVGDAYAALGVGEQQALQTKCKGVLASPARFNSDLVTLCRLIATMR